MKILVLEDNEALLKVIKLGLEKENFTVECFTNGEEALQAISNGYHCFILDINVPSLNGITVLENIRSYLPEVPVLIISSNHELEKIKASYEKGCNDYIKKPFFIYELVQKVKAFYKTPYAFIRFGEEHKYSIAERILYSFNEKVVLTKKELLFLELFVQKPNKTVSYEEIEHFVWEGEITNIDNIRALIKRLRKKLPEESIKSVSGFGYTLECSFE